jgi:uncharacterized membrane protein YgdD (TMEM256/DUF423 family)
MTPRIILLAACVFGALGVLLGAFGAHALKGRLDAAALASFETAVRYQFIHAVVLLAVGVLMAHQPIPGLGAAAVCFVLGILCFAGSIYLLATRALLPLGNLRFLGPVTPLGGLLLLSGWIVLAVSCWRGLRG